MAPVDRPIFITGAPRSGTSLTSQLIAASGAWSGEVNRLWEIQELREKVVKPYLDAAGMCRFALHSFTDARPDPCELREKVLGIIRSQGYEGGPWVYKGAKLVFMWRAWSEAFPEARWVTVWRDPDDVVESLGRWSFTRRKEIDAVRIVREHHDRLRLIPSTPIRPSRLIEGDFRELEELVTILGLRWDPEAVRAIVDPEKWGPR